jgi:hypothetical protein
LVKSKKLRMLPYNFLASWYFHPLRLIIILNIPASTQPVYTKTGKIIVSYNLIFIFLGKQMGRILAAGPNSSRHSSLPPHPPKI